MKRKDFLKKGLVGLGAIIAIPVVVNAFSKSKNNNDDASCQLTPRETRGPFTNKTPAQMVRENIVGDRNGVALLTTFTILDKNNACKPLANVLVDIWHCDNAGNYSEYGRHPMQRADFTKAHFLRGRQTTDANGQVSFISIFPGFYPGRAPHLHIEVLKSDKQSLLATQIAFPEDICNTVYKTENYQGTDYVSNTRDGVFRNSLENNMADTVTGDSTNGYALQKKIIVEG